MKKETIIDKHENIALGISETIKRDNKGNITTYTYTR